MFAISTLLCCTPRRKGGKAINVESEKIALLAEHQKPQPIKKITARQSAAIRRICSHLTQLSFNVEDNKSTRHLVAEDVKICGGWSYWLAESIYDQLLNFISDESNRQSVGEAFARAWDEAKREANNIKEWSKDHPLFTKAIICVIVLGILMLTWPWILEILGFGELGPIEGSWAALWQSTYEGVVPSGSVFSYLQRLAMIRKTWPF